MIELSLYLKIYLDYFPGRLKLAELGKHVLHFQFQCQKLFRLYHNTYVLFCIDFFTKQYQGL